MRYQKFENKYFVRLEVGEDILPALSKLALDNQIQLATISGLGAINELEAGVYYPQTKEYKSNHFEGNFEIVSLHGTITTMNLSPYLHVHISVANEKGEVFGGHLNKAIVSATAEIVVEEVKGEVNRHYSSEIGLNLFEF